MKNVKKTCDQKMDIWTRNGMDKILEKRYMEQFKIAIPELIEKLDQERVEHDSFDDNYKKSFYVGSVFSVFPSGKFYTPWTSNQTCWDVYQDEIFRECLEEILGENDIVLENGEGSSEDLFFIKYMDNPFEDFSCPEKGRAYAKFLDLEFEDWSDIEEDSDTYKYGREEYLILTDNEADEMWDESLDNYIEECILPEIPKQYHAYFDDESFKEDCKRDDGRGHSLAAYDGNEVDMEDPENKDQFFGYRMN